MDVRSKVEVATRTRRKGGVKGQCRGRRTERGEMEERQREE